MPLSWKTPYLEKRSTELLVMGNQGFGNWPVRTSLCLSLTTGEYRWSNRWDHNSYLAGSLGLAGTHTLTCYKESAHHQAQRIASKICSVLTFASSCGSNHHDQITFVGSRGSIPAPKGQTPLTRTICQTAFSLAEKRQTNYQIIDADDCVTFSLEGAMKLESSGIRWDREIRDWVTDGKKFVTKLSPNLQSPLE